VVELGAIWGWRFWAIFKFFAPHNLTTPFRSDSQFAHISLDLSYYTALSFEYLLDTSIYHVQGL
jgi:hypothetical protein